MFSASLFFTATLFAPAFAGSGWLPLVSFNGTTCSGNPIKGFASGGPTNFGNYQTCAEYINNTPGASAIVDRCNVVGTYSQKTSCYGLDTYLPCFNNISGPVGYASVGVYTDAACTAWQTTASPLVGGWAFREGVCQPLDISKPNDAPFVLANCTTGQENFKLFQDNTCSVPFPTAGTGQLLNQQCNAFPLQNGLFTRGRCNQCPPVPSPTPAPAPEGLSGGAIAGIVIGSLAALGLLGGLAYYLSRKKAVPVPDVPLEAPKAVSTTREVVKPVQQTVVTKEVVTTQSVPVTQASTTTQTAYTTQAITSAVAGTGLNPINQYVVGSQYTAAGNWIATRNDELNVKLGDFLRVQETRASDNYVRVVNVNTGASGWVPVSAIKGGY